MPGAGAALMLVPTANIQASWSVVSLKSVARLILINSPLSHSHTLFSVGVCVFFDVALVLPPFDAGEVVFAALPLIEWVNQLI